MLLVLHPLACGSWAHLAPTALESRAYGARSVTIVGLLFRIFWRSVALANLGALSASSRARAALANPNPWPSVGHKGCHVPKFRADLLKTVAVHKEQRTDKQTYRHIYSVLPLSAMLARCMLSSSVCSSVRPSIRLSHAGVVPKGINVGSRKQRCPIARGL